MKSRRLLWTGGWDSTYRLLDLALVRRTAVQPYYVVDPARKSARLELETMQNVRAALDAETARLVMPTEVRQLASIPDDPMITTRIRALRRRAPLGWQYDFLARLAASEGIDDLELTVHVDDRAHPFLADHVAPIGTEDDPVLALRSPVTDPDLVVFASFRFPVLYLSKREMERRARVAGFAHILELTWFCNRPRFGRPCGTCLPCTFTIQEGFGRRLPPTSRALNVFYRAASPAWATLAKRTRTARRRAFGGRAQRERRAG